MFLFIFESIGTSELILIGVVALIFLGPRKMPEYARKIGKLMNEFRSTTNEFKETWEREVNFDAEIKSFRSDDAEPAPVPRITASPIVAAASAAPPMITEADPASFSGLAAETNQANGSSEPASAPDDDVNDRKNWL